MKLIKSYSIVKVTTWLNYYYVTAKVDVGDDDEVMMGIKIWKKNQV